MAAALGYVDTAQAIRKHVDDEDKGVVEATTPGGKQKITTINESGLYSLMLKSKLPGAKKFKRWVTSEVLPSIRRAGAYAMPAAAPADDAMFERLWAELERRQKFNSYVGKFCDYFGWSRRYYLSGMYNLMKRAGCNVDALTLRMQPPPTIMQCPPRRRSSWTSRHLSCFAKSQNTASSETTSPKPWRKHFYEQHPDRLEQLPV